MVVIDTYLAEKLAGRHGNWNFAPPGGAPLSVDRFLAEKQDAGFSFYQGDEPWLEGIQQLGWQTSVTKIRYTTTAGPDITPSSTKQSQER